jgi:hypothetical protein
MGSSRTIEAPLSPVHTKYLVPPVLAKLLGEQLIGPNKWLKCTSVYIPMCNSYEMYQKQSSLASLLPIIN